MANQKPRLREKRTPEEVLADLRELATIDQGDFMAELEGQFGVDFCKTLQEKGIVGPTRIMEHIRTNFSEPTSDRSLSRNPETGTTRIWRNLASGSTD